MTCSYKNISKFILVDALIVPLAILLYRVGQKTDSFFGMTHNEYLVVFITVQNFVGIIFKPNVPNIDDTKV